MTRFEDLLRLVEKPARYAGGELNSVRKPDASARIALCFPDVYEIAMSHLGLKILYAVVNAQKDLAAERCFAPWPDMAEALRQNGQPLTTLETRTPLSHCDIVGFSLQYELSDTTVLEMLALGGIPIRAAHRTPEDPYVVGGGPCAFNPEPMADFFDAFLIGDGEEAVPEMLRTASDARRSRAPRQRALERLAALPGVYVPALARTETRRFTTVVDKRVTRRTLRRLEDFPFPAETVVPNIPATHDRAAVEIMRGCPQRCRFCQAGVIYRPTRFRDPNSVIETAVKSLAATGYDEVGLCSLSSGDYPYLERVSEVLMGYVGAKKTSLSLSSLRASAVNENLSYQISRGKRTGFTIAPEAGSQRLRDVIAKNISEQMIMDGCRDAFALGWSSLKLYFMIGQPTETQEDVEAIVALARRIVAAHPGKRVTVSVSSFVPKPHTPFQWAAQDTMEVLLEKQELLRGELRRVRGTRFKYHDVRMSFLEAIISRGDRRVGAVIEAAWRLGQRFDGWSEQFDHERWRRAIAETGLEASAYTGAIPIDERLPWDHIQTMVPKAELEREWRRALGATTTVSCLDVACRECKACTSREGDYLKLKRVEVRDLPSPAPVVARGPFIYRGFYSKVGAAALQSHLDLGHALRMAFRRSRLRLAFTEGYAPLPKLSYGPPLPVGMEGGREVVDFGLSEEVEPGVALAALNEQMPEGLHFQRVLRLPGLRSHIARELDAAVYETALPGADVEVTPGGVSDARLTVRSVAISGAAGKLFLLVHPEARIDAVLARAAGVVRRRSEFARTALVLVGENWLSLLPAEAGAVEVGRGALAMDASAAAR